MFIRSSHPALTPNCSFSLTYTPSTHSTPLSTTLPRCTCRAYLSSFCQILSPGNSWKCALCHTTNALNYVINTNSHYNQESTTLLDVRSFNKKNLVSPVLQHDEIEIDAPMVQLKCNYVVFAVECTANSIDRGVCDSVVNDIIRVVKGVYNYNNEYDTNTINNNKYAVIFFNNHTHILSQHTLHTLPPNTINPSLLPSDYFFSPNEFLNLPLIHTLNYLKCNKTNNNDLSNTINNIYNILSSVNNGIVLSFLCTTPNTGNGILSNKNINDLKVKNNFYKDMSMLFSKKNISMSYYLFPDKDIELPSLSIMARITGGFINYLPNYVVDTDVINTNNSNTNDNYVNINNNDYVNNNSNTNNNMFDGDNKHDQNDYVNNNTNNDYVNNNTNTNNNIINNNNTINNIINTNNTIISNINNNNTVSDNTTPSLYHHLYHFLTKPLGHSALLKIRTSSSVKITDYYGNFHIKNESHTNSQLLSFCMIDFDHSITIGCRMNDIDGEYNGDEGDISEIVEKMNSIDSTYGITDSNYYNYHNNSNNYYSSDNNNNHINNYNYNNNNHINNNNYNNNNINNNGNINNYNYNNNMNQSLLTLTHHHIPFQIAIIYTNTMGIRKLRITNFILPFFNINNQLFINNKELSKFLMLKCINEEIINIGNSNNVIESYIKNNKINDNMLRLINNIKKSPIIRPSIAPPIDYRSFYIHLLLTGNKELTDRIINPLLINIKYYIENDDNNYNNIDDIIITNLSRECMDIDGIYIMDAGYNFFFFITTGLNDKYINDNINHINKIKECVIKCYNYYKYNKNVLYTDYNKNDNKLINMVYSLRKNIPLVPSFHLIRDDIDDTHTSLSKQLFFSYFYDDEIHDVESYKNMRRRYRNKNE